MADFAAMNKTWIEWLDPTCKPARACVQAPMAKPGILFEVMIIAAQNPTPASS
jgi:enamine deaminase RidA (YjgF/YER057c/UK114 family)